MVRYFKPQVSADYSRQANSGPLLFYWQPEITFCQVTLFYHIQGILRTGKVPVSIIGANSEFYYGLFCPFNEICRRYPVSVINLHSYIIGMQGVNNLIHPLFRPEMVISFSHLPGKECCIYIDIDGLSI